jgi:hypothetical protein
MKDFNSLTWEEKKAYTNITITNINANFDKYKEEVAMLGHAIGYRNVDIKLAGMIWPHEYDESEVDDFIFKMAELIMTSDKSPEW